MAWNIQYENDARPSIQVAGSRAKAEQVAIKRNKYGESFTVTEALRPDRTFEMEQAYDEAVKYGCSRPPRA